MLETIIILFEAKIVTEDTSNCVSNNNFEFIRIWVRSIEEQRTNDDRSYYKWRHSIYFKLFIA